MKRFLSYIVIVCICLCSCTKKENVVSVYVEKSLRDSTLNYKIQGWKEFIAVADYWGDDSESYWAFDRAVAILDSVSRLDRYEAKLAGVYAATSYVGYGLSYFSSVLTESRRRVTGEEQSFPPVGIKECADIIIDDYSIESDSSMCYNLNSLELKAIYSMLYYYKAIDYGGFEDNLLYNFNESKEIMELIYPEAPHKVAYRICSVFNMQMWYKLIVINNHFSQRELYQAAPDFSTAPWKEFTDLAMWHDSLSEDIDPYLTMSDEDFCRIELKAAYTQYIMLKNTAKNLAMLKERAAVGRK